MITVQTANYNTPGIPRICAVVVTHNRKTLLLDCLDALVRQNTPLAGVCLVNNASQDGTEESLLAAGYLPDLAPSVPSSTGEWCFQNQVATAHGRMAFHYLHMPDNIGGAGGFDRGMRHAVAAGYGGLWLLDDDAEPEPDALGHLLKHWNDQSVSALAGAVHNGMELSLLHRGHFDFRFNNVFPLLHKPVQEKDYVEETLDIDMSSFVGLLVKSEVTKEIGFPRREFFLHNDDAEYCIRLRRHGRILLVPESRVQHHEARTCPKLASSGLGFSRCRPRYQELWVIYYGLRNLTWVGRTYHKNSLYFFLAVLKSWARALTSVLLFDRDHQWKRVLLLSTAYADGLRGVFDNSKPRRVLYGCEKDDPSTSETGS